MKILKPILGAILCLFIVSCVSIPAGEVIEPTPDVVVVTPAPTPTPAPIKTVFGFTEEFELYINQVAEYYNLPADLVRAVIWVESRGQINADNGLCVGLMQLNRQYADTFMQATGSQNITDPGNNVLCGCWWLSELLNWAEGEENLALMAYNMGQSKALKKWQTGFVTQYVIDVQEARSMFNG
ncbi:MAG: transglycosylase SLT domain-containing protein [Oscillospiraceae bacterium]|nr:transglycosylase SLT domain-containing protein [Oscillospiraceae bacterium]